MRNILRGTFPLLALVLGMTAGSRAAEKKEIRYTVGAGSSISIVNRFGPISIRPSSGQQVIVTATPVSNKVEVDSDHNGNRVIVRTHFLQKATADEGRVEYDVQVPADADVSIRTATGPVRIEHLNGDISVEADAAKVDVNDANNSHVHVRTVDGPITLANVRNGHVEVTSVGGEVNLNNVAGMLVSVNTTGGKIHYDGDFAAPGEYSMVSHTGDIDITLPASASVDITARSVRGSVENDFPFQPQSHPTFTVSQGKSFAGTANTGASTVRLRSFGGKIRVKKK